MHPVSPRRGDARTIVVLAVLTLLALVGLAATACSSAFEVEDEGLRVRAEDGAVSLRNGTGAAVFYFLVERNTAAVIDWIPCLDPETCARVDDGETLRIAHEEITGWEEGESEAILYWWHLVEREPPIPPGEAAYRWDEIRSVEIELE